jgi:DedD protein
MSFEIPEQAKYRLTGGILLILIAVIVMPGLMKKSNQRFEENLSLNLKVPPKPSMPVMNIPTAHQVFNHLKTTKVEEPKLVKREVSLNVTKAEDLHVMPVEMTLPKTESVKVINEKVIKQMATSTKISAKSYGVQLASFSHAENANFLIRRLKKLGYEAQSFEIAGRNGKIYQVVVGKLSDKEQAQALQEQLAQNLQLQGMVVSKG